VALDAAEQKLGAEDNQYHASCYGGDIPDYTLIHEAAPMTVLAAIHMPAGVIPYVETNSLPPP
jgi:hypothetical protein